MPPKLSVELEAKINNFKSSMREAGDVTESTVNRIDKSTSKISDFFSSRIAGIFSVAAIAGFTREVINATAEFQKFSAVLSNTLGSQALADIKIREIQDFAAKTPFGVNELTGAFVKLANSGFKPTGDQMTKLGDIASSTGKSFDQLAEAIIDAQTGEYERLKEFGIRAKDAGANIIFTYKGVQTQVEKTSGSIREYITSLGDAEGTSGAMAKISATLGGQISNLGDSWDQMLLSVGSNTEGVFNSSIAILNDVLNKITEVNERARLITKYDLGNDFFNQLNRTVNPFADRITDIELAAEEIKIASDNVGKLVSNAVAGAKSVTDLSNALAQLKKEGDAALTAPTVGPKGLELTEKTRRAIKEEYQKGVKALQQARLDLLKPVSDANFGTAKKGKSQEKADEEALKSQQDLFDKIQNLRDKYLMKAQTDEQAAMTAILNDFRTISTEIDREAKKYDKYVQKYGSKKALSVLGARPDSSLIAGMQDSAVSSLEYQQNTELFKKQLARELGLYQDFEALKTQIGIQAAKERYGDIIRTETNALNSLKAEMDRILNGRNFEDLNGNEQDRYKAAQDLYKGLKDIDRKTFDDLLKSTADYETQRTAIQDKYETQRAELVSAGRMQNVAELDRLHALSIQSLDDQNAETLTVFQDLFYGIEKLGDKAARSVVDKANEKLKELVSSGKISAQLAREIGDRLTDAGQSLSSRLPTRLMNLSGELNTLAGVVGDIDSGFGTWLSTLGNVLGNLGQIQTTIGKIGELKKGDILGGITGGLSILSAGFSLANSISGLLSSGGQKQKEQADYQSELTLKRTESLNNLLQRQIDLGNAAYGVEKIKIYNDAIKTAEENQKAFNDQLSGRYVRTGNKDLDKLIDKVNNGEKLKAGQERVTFEAFAKSGIIQRIDDVTSYTLDQLQKLRDNPYLDDFSKKVLDNLINSKKAVIELGDSIKESLTGTTFTAFADGFFNLFADADTSSKEFAKSAGDYFKDSMKKAVLESFKTKFLADQLRAFYDKFEEYSASGGVLDSNEEAALKLFYDNIVKAGTDRIEELKRLGIDFGGSSPANDPTVRGIGAQLTEETGTELSGRLLGVQLSSIETNRILNNHGVYFQNSLTLQEGMMTVTTEIRDTNLRIANNTDALSGIALSLKSLDAKVSNTGGSLTAAGVI